MTGDQVKQARELLGLTRYRLSQRCGIPEHAIHTFELANEMTCGYCASATVERRLTSLRAMLEAAGVEFTNGDAPGVKLRKVEG